MLPKEKPFYLTALSFVKVVELAIVVRWWSIVIIEMVVFLILIDSTENLTPKRAHYIVEIRQISSSYVQYLSNDDVLKSHLRTEF